MMRANTSRRITKPIVFAIMLIAVTLVCGLLFTSINVNPAFAATYPMTVPNNTWNDTHVFAIADMKDCSTQSSISTLSTLGTTNVTSFSIASGTQDTDYTNLSSPNSFTTTANSWKWVSNASSGVNFSVAFMHTYQISETMFERLSDGLYTVSASATASASVTGGSADWYDYMYVGIGYAENDDAAKTIGGFNEIKGYVGTGGDPNSDKIEINAPSSNPDSITNYSLGDVAAKTTSTQQKYLRVGVYARPWQAASSTIEITVSNVSLTIASVTPTMSMPTDFNTNNGLTWTQAEMVEYVTQSSEDIKTISTLDYTDTATSFTGIDNTTKYVSSSTGKFTSNDTWYYASAPAGSSTLYHVGFMHTYKLTEEVFNAIISNRATLGLRMSANLTSSTQATPDARLWLYAGIGTAGSDNAAVAYAGFKQLANNYCSHMYYANSNDFSSLSLDTYFSTSSSSTQNKYLRIAFMTEVWPGSSSSPNLNLSSVRINFNMEENIAVDTSVPTTNSMTRPSTWDAATFYDYASNSANFFQQQKSMVEIGSNLNNLTSSNTSYFPLSGNGIAVTGFGTNATSTSDSTAYAFFSGTTSTLTSSSTPDSFTTPYTHDFYYTYGKPSQTGFFYTLKLTETTYNALLSGAITLNLETPKLSASNLGNTNSGRAEFVGYLGLGYAASDDDAKNVNAFTEIKGYVGNMCTYYGGGGTGNGSATDCNITNFKFTQTEVKSSGKGSNGNTKYLRFGVWARYYYTSDRDGVKLTCGPLNFSMTPTSDTAAPVPPSFADGVTSSNSVTITDASGLQSYTINGQTVKVAKISNISMSTNTTITLPAYGTYTISAVDIWGNATSSSVTFNYFHSTVYAQANTDGTQGDYSGGGVVFGKDYTNLSSYKSQQISHSGNYTMQYNLWAHPNDGYYFAGFTIDSYSNINLDLITQSISTAGTYSGTNGSYSTINGDTREYKFTWNIYTNVIIPADGKFYITAHFKSIPTTNNSATYDGMAKKVTIGDVSNAPGVGTMSKLAVSYTDSASNTTTSSPINAGTYVATSTITWNGNVVGVKTENLTIAQRETTATYTLTDTARNYNGSNDCSDYVSCALSNLVDGDNIGLAVVATTADANVGANKALSISATLNGTSSVNYAFTNPTDNTKTFTINTAPVEVVFEVANKPYDGNATASVTVGSITGLIGTESILYNDLSATYADKYAGDNKKVTLTNPVATAGEGTSLLNYSITTNKDSLTANISKIELTIDYLLTTSKVYDGNVTASVSDVQASGYIGDDNTRLSISVTATYDDSNASINRIISIVVAVSGTESINYWTEDPEDVSGIIEKRYLTITADDKTKVYGEATPASSYSVSATNGDNDGTFVTADDESASNITITIPSVTNAGNYTISATVENNNENYYLSAVDGSYTITKRPVTVTLKEQGGVYGTPDLGVDQGAYEVSANGGYAYLGDDLGISISKAGDMEVGAHALSATSSNTNHEVNFVIENNFVITKRDLTITLGAQGSVYGEAITLSNTVFTTTGLVIGDSVEVIISKADGTQKGEYALSGVLNTESVSYAHVVKNYNYTIVPGIYTISRRAITIILAPQGSVYGITPVVNQGVDYFSLDTTDGKFDLASGDAKEDLNVTITKEDGINAGEYELTFTWNNDNYEISGASGVYAITKATLDVTYVSETITYGGTPGYAVTYAGFKYTDNEDAVTTKATLDTANLAYTGSNITANGEGYQITPKGAEALNYDFNYFAGTLTVLKKNLSVAYIEEITYGQSPVTSITASEFTVTGLIGEEGVGVLTLTANLPTSAGTHTITSGNFTFQATNYEVTEVSGSLTINKAQLEVIIGAPSTIVHYGDSITLNVTYGTTGKNFVNGENADTALTQKVVVDFASITNEKGYVSANESGYDLATLISQEATADNYEIIHTAQILYVYKKELTLTYQGESKVYDALIPTPSKDKVVVSGLVDGESLEYLGESEGFDYNLAVNAPKAQVGEYLVYATYVYGGGRDALNNYDIKFVRDYYDITHATLTATYVSESIVFGATPTGAVVYSGFKGSDNEDVVITKATVSFESIDNVTILGENSYVNVKEGGYALAPEGASAVNYVFNYVEGTLTVTKREASLVLVDQTSVYGIAPVVGQGTEYYELTGLLEGDSLTSLTITKEEGITVGSYVLDAVVVAPNYEVAVTKATYTITQATLNVTISFNRASVLDIDVASLTTGDFTIEYAGWQYTDDESLLDTPVSVDLDAIISTATEAGEYTILYIVGNDDQYIFNYVSVGTIVVVASEKDVDISGLSFTSKSLPYNGQEQYLEVVWNDQPEEVDVEISYTYSKPFHKDVDVYSVIASFRVKTSGYKDNIPSMEASLTITALDVSLTLAPQGSVYGEAVEVKQGDEYYTVSGTLIEGDDLGVVITKSDVMNANHGEYDLDATISNTNYNLVSVTTNVYTISKVNVTVKLRNQVGGYGKTAQIAQGEYDIVAGALVDEGDMVITLSVETATLYEVGESYAITAEIVPNEWYVFDVIDAEYTVVAMAIQITLNNVIATYGDDVDATTTYTLTSGTLADEGDDLGLVFSITPADKYVVGGDYSISATASNDNYVVEVIGAKYVVEAKYIEIKVADQNSTYGEEYVIKNDFALVEGFSLEYDDEKKDLGVIVTVNSSSLNAGTHVLSATTSTTNYNVKVINGTYVIAKATTVFYTEKLQKEYTYTGNAINFKTDTSYVYTNRPNNQSGIKLPTVSVINAGHYTVTFSINESTNYASASVDVNIVVLKANPVVDMSVLLNKTYVYNGVEQYITASKEDLLVKADFDEVTLSWSGEVFKDVPETGNKLVELTLSETTNYFPATFTQTVPINKARYDFTGLDYAFAGLSKEYDGEECSVQVVNLPAGITVAYSYKDTIQEAPFRFKNAGDYIVKAIYSYDEVNYERPTELIETAYVQIERIDITVEVVDQHGYYGDAPEFDSNGINVIAGTFVEGDEIDLSLQLEPKESYPIGVYKLVANTMASGNYNVTIASGSYTINPRPITVTINNEQAQYGDEEKPYSFKITEGTLIGEDQLKSTLVRETGKTPGEYAISGSVVNPNYIVKVIPGVYKIVPRLITIEVFNQEGTSAKQLNKRAYKTFGKILKGDNLNIQVVGEIGSTPGEYPLSATYTENPNYEVVIKGGVFIMRKVAEISVDNPIVYKLYDGVPYVFDVFVSSGAEPVFSIDGIFVENSFTEVGVYNLSINADVKGDYASPDPYRITFEIRPTVLETENDGVVVKVTKVDGFGAEERLEIEKDPSVVLSGEDFSSKIDTALTIYVVQGENRVPLQEYMQGREAHIKIKLNDQLTEIGAETWFVDSDSNVLYEAPTPDEEGFIEVTLADSNHILFVTQRNEATPILVVSGGMLIIFLAMGMFFLFRKKFIN